MAVSAEVVAVTTAAAPLNAVSTGGLRLLISTSANIGLGGATVTGSSGYPLTSADSPITVELDAGDVLYAAAAATANVSVLRT